MRFIKIENSNLGGDYTVIDTSDFDKVSKYKWHYFKNRHTYYVARTIGEKGKRRIRRLEKTKISMKKMLIGLLGIILLLILSPAILLVIILLYLYLLGDRIEKDLE